MFTLARSFFRQMYTSFLVMFCTRTVFQERDIKNIKDINRIQYTMINWSMFTTNIVPYVRYVCVTRAFVTKETS